MKQGTFNTFPQLRRSYQSVKELGEVINRGRTTTIKKLNEGCFTTQEKKLIAADLVKKNMAENIAEALTFLEA